MKIRLVTLAATFMLLACNKGAQSDAANTSKSSAASTADTAAAQKSAAPAAKATLPIPKLGLVIALPAETTLSKNTDTEFDINPPDDTCNLNISKEDPATSPASFDQLVKDAEATPPDDNGFVVKEWKTKTKGPGEAYTLVFKHLTLKDDKAGKDKPRSYRVEMRVVVGKDTYDCQSRLDTTLEGATCVVNACNSLAKG
jgi:hypothetical protein